MLPLDSERWAELSTFFDEPENVPIVLREWLDAIGFDQERLIYGRDLFDVFLHQGTITNVAFAIVPWLVDACARNVTRHRADYLLDVAMVEANRLSGGVYYNRPGTEVMPDWLMADYHPAVEAAQNLADDALDGPLEENLRDALTRMKPALFGNAVLAWKQWTGQ